MRTIQKTLAGACLLFGLSISLLATAQIADADDDLEDLAETGAALVLFGLAPTALGGWLAWNLRHSNRQTSQSLSLQQEQMFLQLLQNQAGDLTIIQFAAAAQLPIEQAKTFLDQKAQLLNATFEVKDTGAIVYRFPL
ncbi:hypothetical protein IQ273_06610 [Nodosilinea sp. LEGE 07298]|uniref:hypothetical protein n=1 Tax=Nodosilinea sp. LEGE 07298 TaxID=2777970 RepID=UPI00187E4E77|nr:hypothetical protein [Nodosilinea sp. LEGE 07298]MBE9109090.1 hypothetical protein [Nodosilinea sp. LEGE 07298]